MAIYIILSKIAPTEFANPKEFKELASTVAREIKSQCTGAVWVDSYATLGRFDVVDIVESDDIKQVQKAAMIIRGYGRTTTETLVATPWKEFLANM